MNDSSVLWFEVLVIPPDLGSVAEARAFVGANLTSHNLRYLVDDIQLAVSELVTNALVHGLPPVIVTMEEQRLDVLVTVSDGGPGLPVPLPQDATALGGRGLSIVGLVSSEWGTNRTLDGGKSVWARFDKGAHATTPARSQAQPA